MAMRMILMGRRDDAADEDDAIVDDILVTILRKPRVVLQQSQKISATACSPVRSTLQNSDYFDDQILRCARFDHNDS